MKCLLHPKGIHSGFRGGGAGGEGEVIENIEKAQYKKEKEMYSYTKEKNQK